MPNTGDEYTAVPGNAIGAIEYPSTMLAQANQLQAIQDRLLKKRKVVDSKGFKKPTMVAAPYTTMGSHQFATEDFFRHKLKTIQELKKSKYRSLGCKVKEVDSPGFLPDIWRGDPAAGIMKSSYT